LHLFYEPNIESTLTLSKEESKHCSKVLRLSIGDEISITDGKGKLFNATITAIGSDSTSVVIQQTTSIEPLAPSFSLYIAPTKNNKRMEWMTEKLTEIGFNNLIFYLGDHSERIRVRLERINKTMVSAIKQSQKVWLPKVAAKKNFAGALAHAIENHEQVFIAHFSEDHGTLFEQLDIDKDCAVIVGPEGDISKRELELAKQEGVSFVNLSKYRLRTETAGLVACQIFRTKADQKTDKR